jgi:hypothetical protein
MLVHRDRGEQSVEEVVRGGNVHDAVHYLWDIERSIAAT